MKKTAKDMMLSRIRKAIAPAAEPPTIHRDFRTRDERDQAALLEDFIERLVDCKAMVTRTDDASLPSYCRCLSTAWYHTACGAN